MYHNNFVASLKSEKNFFKERDGGFVEMPFGTEYSVYLKNLNSRDAVASVSVDGMNVTSGHKLIVRAKSILVLDGFMDGFNVRNRFRFIERTKQIDEHRGVRPEDGIISVEFNFEKEEKRENYPYVIYTTPYPYWMWDNNNPYRVTTTWTTVSGSTTNTNSGNNIQSQLLSSAYTIQNNSNPLKMPVDNLDGITVPGSDVYEQFGLGYVGELEETSHVISLKVFGIKQDNNKSAIFSKDKIECPTCGYKNKNYNKFCSNCGTRLLENK